MSELDLNLYVLAELKYKKEFSNKSNIFPNDWYSTNNYKLKIEIITEALKNKIKIEDTNLYQTKFLEQVKTDE